MRKYTTVFIIVTLLLSALLPFGGTALAAGESLSVETTVTELKAGGTVDFTGTIIAGDTDLIGYKIMCGTTECYNSGGATLLAGEPKEVNFSFDVTDAMLGSNITFTLVSSGNNLTTDSVLIAKKELEIKIAGSRKVSQTLAAPGDTITFTFTVENQGEADLDDIVVSAPELNGGDPLNVGFSLPAGQSHSFPYKHTMAAETTVNPIIKYSSGGVEQSPKTLEPIELRLESRKVDPVLTVDNESPNADEEVTFTLTVTNKGNVPYTNMVVTLDGEEQDFPTTKLNQGDSPSQTYKMSFATSTEVKFNITLKDHTGEIKNVDSNAIFIELPVDPGSLEEKLHLVMNVDRPQLTSAGTINFSGYISNASEYTLNDISIEETQLGNIFSTTSMAPGSKENISYIADINETTTYQFVLKAKDRDGKEYTIESDPITVTINAAPVQTGFEDAVEITPTPSIDTEEAGGSNSLGFLLIIFIILVVLIIGVGVALLVLWKKGRGTPKRTGVVKTSSGKKRPSVGRKPTKKRPTKSYKDRNNF